MVLRDGRCPETPFDVRFTYRIARIMASSIPAMRPAENKKTGEILKFSCGTRHRRPGGTSCGRAPRKRATKNAARGRKPPFFIEFRENPGARSQECRGRHDFFCLVSSLFLRGYVTRKTGTQINFQIMLDVRKLHDIFRDLHLKACPAMRRGDGLRDAKIKIKKDRNSD